MLNNAKYLEKGRQLRQDGRTSVNLQIRPIERRNGTSVSIRTHGNRGGQVVTRNYLSGCTDIGSHTVMSQLRDGDRWSEKYNSQMMRPAVRRPQTPMEPRPQPIRTATWSMLDLRDPKETFLLLPDPRVNRNSQLLWSTPYTSSSSRPVPSSSAIQANSMRPPLSKTKSVSLIPRPQACWKTSQQMVSGLTPKFRTSSAIDLSKSYGEEKPPRAVSSKIFTYVPKPTEEIARNDRNSRLTSAKEQNQLPLNKSNRGVQRITIIREREQNDRSVADPISYDMDSIDEETSPMWVLPKHFSSLSLEPLSEVLEDGVTETAVRPLPLPQAKSNYPRPRNGKCTYSSEFSPSAGSVTSIKPIVYRPPVCLENYQARGIDLRPTDSANYGWSRKGDQYRSTPNMLNFESFSPATFPRPLVYRPHQAGANSTNFSDQIGFYSSPNGIKFNGTVGNATDEDEEADEESEIEIDDADGGDNATHPTYIPVPTKRHSVSKNVTSSYSTNYSYPRVTDEESEMSSDFTGHYPDPRQSSNQGKMYTLPPKLSAPAFTNGLTAYNGVQRRPQNRKSISIGRPYHSDLRRQSFNYPPPDREYNKRWSVQIPFGTMKDIFSQPARERRKSVVSPAYQEGNQSDFSDLRTEFKGGTDGTEPNSFYDGYQSRLPYEHLPEALRKTVIAEKFRRPLSFCESAASGDVSTKHRSSEDRRRSISKANSFGLYQSPLVPSKQRAFSDWDVTKLNWVHSPEK
ncbi:unnamed protein product [Calicophoron daubneyi]|uniref:Uncharacterized protein n=1 Tax=Calicophoron daubneyi TaxID=300641 RepID=A0AAV2TG97_CALDB